eukprot:824476-Pleurochrysis_carterae.AAC.4
MPDEVQPSSARMDRGTSQADQVVISMVVHVRQNDMDLSTVNSRLARSSSQREAMRDTHDTHCAHAAGLHYRSICSNNTEAATMIPGGLGVVLENH